MYLVTIFEERRDQYITGSVYNSTRLRSKKLTIVSEGSWMQCASAGNAYVCEPPIYLDTPVTDISKCLYVRRRKQLTIVCRMAARFFSEKNYRLGFLWIAFFRRKQLHELVRVIRLPGYNVCVETENLKRHCKRCLKQHTEECPQPMKSVQYKNKTSEKNNDHPRG